MPERFIPPSVRRRTMASLADAGGDGAGDAGAGDDAVGDRGVSPPHPASSPMLKHHAMTLRTFRQPRSHRGEWPTSESSSNISGLPGATTGPSGIAQQARRWIVRTHPVSLLAVTANTGLGSRDHKFAIWRTRTPSSAARGAHGRARFSHREGCRIRGAASRIHGRAGILRPRCWPEDP